MVSLLLFTKNLHQESTGYILALLEHGNLWAAVHLLLVPQAWEQPLLSIYEVRLKRKEINRKVITV